MGEKGRKVGLQIAGTGVGALLLGSVWTGTALADSPSGADAGSSSRIATTPAADRGSGPGVDFCRYFSSRAAAQVYFTSVGGSVTNNPRGLDADHNGLACEDHDYGTYQYGAAGTSVVGTRSGGSGSVPTRGEDGDDGTAGRAGSRTPGPWGPTTGPAQVSVVPHGGVDTGDGSSTR